MGHRGSTETFSKYIFHISFLLLLRNKACFSHVREIKLYLRLFTIVTVLGLALTFKSITVESSLTKFKIVDILSLITISSFY